MNQFFKFSVFTISFCALSASAGQMSEAWNNGAHIAAELADSVTDIPNPSAYRNNRANLLNALMNCTRENLEAKRYTQKNAPTGENEAHAILRTAASFLSEVKENAENDAKLESLLDRCKAGQASLLQARDVKQSELQAELEKLNHSMDPTQALGDSQIMHVITNFALPVETCRSLQLQDTAGILIAIGDKKELQFCQVTNGTQYFRIGGALGLGWGIMAPGTLALLLNKGAEEGGKQIAKKLSLGSQISVAKTQRRINIDLPAALRVVDLDGSDLDGKSPRESAGLLVTTMTKTRVSSGREIQRENARTTIERGFGLGLGGTSIHEVKLDIPLIPAGDNDEYLYRMLLDRNTRRSNRVGPWTY